MKTQKRRLMWHGMLLFLLGLITGLLEQRFTNVRMGLSARSWISCLRRRSPVWIVRVETRKSTNRPMLPRVLTNPNPVSAIGTFRTPPGTAQR